MGRASEASAPAPWEQEIPEEMVTHACECVKTSAFGVSFLIVCVWVIGLSPPAHCVCK